MSEQYRFMRYYLPGSLLLFYSALLMIASLSVNDLIRTLNKDGIIAVFLGFLGASPAIGYLIYAFYNELYERRARDSKKRHALPLVEKWAKEKGCKFQSPTQKKEFLDLVYHESSSSKNPAIGPEILETMKNHLSNYSARVICGALVPIFALIVYAIFIVLLNNNIIPSLNLCINLWLLVPSAVIIGSASFFLLWRSRRVLDEAFALEEFLILSREENAKRLLDSIASALGEEDKLS